MPDNKVGGETKLEERPQSALRRRLNYYFNWPVVIDPFGKPYYRWQIIISTAVLYNVFCVPSRMAFEQLREPHLDVMWLALDYTSDGLYIFDIIWHLFIGIPRKGIPAADLRVSRKQYYHGISFKFDVFSILPTDILYWQWGIRMAALRINRLARFHRVQELFARTHVHSNHGVYFRFLEVLLYSIIFVHFNGCLYYGLNIYNGLGYDEWTFPNYATGNVTDHEGNAISAEEGNFFNLYLRSFQWSLVVLAQDVDGLIYNNVVECLLRIFVTIEGTFLMGAGIAIAEHLLASKNRHLEAYQRRLDAVKQYMLMRQVDKSMQKRVLGWFNYVWEVKQFSDEQTDLEILPPILRLSIAKISFQDTFQRVKLFRGCEPQALEELIMRLQLQFYCPGDLVFRKGDVAREMYIVRSGLLQAVSEDGLDVYATLSQGSVFGEVSLLSGLIKADQKRTNTVRSQSYSELFTLSKSDFQEVLENFPLAKQAVVARSRPNRTDPGEESPEANKSPLEVRLDTLETKAPTLISEMGQTLAAMIRETNELKQQLARLEYLDKFEPKAWDLQPSLAEFSE
ncbi:Cyclic nucleotide-gated channel cone photoreceptor subunit alpha [Hypsibius exemplaris]|uniref:Cyclic nucleotide-gated channel cone photoreceptor subunit alpha n=1 Tax=Hypsibius exemplaris TaxID=2072580 RepID=A0A1W0XF98_HYPEX|nr:Cyclic nucleotide-gated channel cone photoreceptor subunit alpha [Hypsibius exemplaris]